MDSEIQRHRLDNGLTVILRENHDVPVVSFQVWVRAGSAYELPGEEGITHLLEHMIFKGSESFPAGEMDRRIESLGGDSNAYTHLDHTNYHVTAASANAPEVLELLADALVNPAFDAGELEREKEVVIEEMRMHDDNPQRRLSKQVMAFAYGRDHPYGRPVIGSEASVRAVSRQDIVNYRNRLYRGPNMVLVASGDFSSSALLPLIRKYFAPLSPEPAPAFILPEPEDSGQAELLLLREEVNQATISISWLTPGLPSPEVYPLDVAAGIMGEGVTSRLYWRLKEMQGLADSVGASAYTPQGVGLMTMQASMDPDKVESAWQPFLEESLSLIAQPAEIKELERVRTGISGEFVRSAQTVQGQASMLGYFELLRGGFENAGTYLDRYRRVSSFKVSDALKNYLVPPRLKVIIQLPPAAAAPSQEEVQSWAAQVWNKAAAESPDEEMGVLEASLPNGLTLLVVPRHSVPLASMVLAVPHGLAAEPAELAGINQLWAGSLIRGNQQYDYESLAAFLESMAADMRGFASRNMMGLSASFLSENLEQGLELFSLCWQRPLFAAGEVDKARDEQRANLRSQLDKPIYPLLQKLREALFPAHPYGREPLGSGESLAHIRSQDLQKLHQRLQTTQGSVLVVVGDVNPKAVQLKLEHLFAAAPKLSLQPTSYPLSPAPDAQKEVIADDKMQQTQILLGFRTPPLTDPDTHALEVIRTILGGMGGRLFSDLRGRQSLAYSVQPFYNAGMLAGTFGVYMSTTPGKEETALAGLNQHLDNLRRLPVAELELARAKNYFLGVDAIDQQSLSAQATTMARDYIAGLGYDYNLKMAAAIRDLTPQDILEAAEKVFDPAGCVTVIYEP
jgi:zinc protease